MNYKNFEQTRKRWGDKPCNHPSTVKEILYMGVPSGDYICTQCGQYAYDDDKQQDNSNKSIDSK